MLLDPLSLNLCSKWNRFFAASRTERIKMPLEGIRSQYGMKRTTMCRRALALACAHAENANQSETSGMEVVIGFA